MDDITAQVEKLCMANRINRGMAVGIAVCFAVALLLLLRGQIPYGVLLLAVSVVLLLMARQLGRQYARNAAAANLCFGLARDLEGFAYRASGGMDEAAFRAWSLLPLADGDRRLLCRNTFSGRRDGLDLAGSEVTFHYKADAGGTAGYRFLSGTLLTAETGDRPGGDGWLLLNGDLAEEPELRRFLEEAGWRPAAALNGRRLFARGEQTPGEDLLSRLSGLPESVTALRLASGGAAAYLDRRFYTGARYPSARPTPERLRENTLPERDPVWDLFGWWLSPDRPR